MGFAEMPNSTKIAVAGGCLALALGIGFWQFKDSIFPGSGGQMEPVVMLCTNPKCEKAFKLKPDEFQKLMQEMGPMGGMPPMMMMGQQPAYTCKFCGQKTAYIAMECKKCKAVFIPKNPMTAGQSNEPYDKCPECGYSDSAEMSKQQQ
jgi:hypothetical protein